MNDHATISGYMLDGYKLGFELYKQASGTDAAKDTKVNGVDPVSCRKPRRNWIRRNSISRPPATTTG